MAIARARELLLQMLHSLICPIMLAFPIVTLYVSIVACDILTVVGVRKQEGVTLDICNIDDCCLWVGKVLVVTCKFVGSAWLASLLLYIFVDARRHKDTILKHASGSQAVLVF